ncbi:MAG: glycoside hydrolase family 3 C-terminal domain-containing protein [Clostridiales bacterium]|nr:glycoside hydrolase family 3 C-terminal domain-containing protein [Candidatus Blautia equi]
MKAIRINTPDVQPFETEHIAAVRALSPECMVLLKNDGTLPIAKGGKLALYGGGARRTIKGGTGSGDVNSRKYITVEEGLENAGYEITTKAWLDAYDEAVMTSKKAFYGEIRKQADAAGMNPIFFSMGKVAPEPDYNFPLDGEGDTAVYVLARISGEGADRTPTAGDINLTEAEIRDIKALNAKYDKFVLVLNTGGMVDLSPVNEVGSILIMGQLGVSTGDALADVLTGVSYPSGKLTMTWAPINDYPSTEGFGDPNDTYYKEGVYVGYRYFDTVAKAPTYEFGYGLGYTTFDIAAKSVAVEDGIVKVTASVTNTGAAAGKEVVQVYYSAPAVSIDKPYQELAGYVKTAELKAGESQEVTITFAVKDMASYDTAKAAWVLDPGAYYIRVGNSSRNTAIAAAIVLDAEAVTEKDTNICADPGFEDLKPETAACACEADAKAAAPVINISAADIETKVVTYSEVMEEIPAGETITWDKVVSKEKTIRDFAAGLTDEQLAWLCIGDYFDSDDMMEVIGNASSTVAGAAGETTNRMKKDLGLPSLVMADGPAGVRISQSYKLYDNNVAKGGSSLGGDMMLVFTDEELAGMAAGEDDGREAYYQYCTAIPIGTGIAQSFNVDLAETLGKLVGVEMRMFNCPIWLAPAQNIYRSPLCGRNFEYYSEDPLVSGRVSAAITKGVQTAADCATTIKHYAFNNQETNRYFSNSNLSERAMREIYLKGFEIAVKESQPQFIMTSYNLVNGEHTCNSYDLNTKVLRDEWGFEGVVMTDWLVTGGMGPKGDVHPAASAAGNVKVGNDITMPGLPSDMADMMNALKDENHPYHITRAELQTCAMRVLEKIYVMDEAGK